MPMLKDKATIYALTGGMMLVGLVAGVAVAASAQTVRPLSTPSAPVVMQTANTSSAPTSIDTPETPNDPADNDRVEGSEKGVNVSATSISPGHPHEQQDQETNDDGNEKQN